MLGVPVPRLKLAAVVLLALLTAGQLALHHHSLAPESGAASLLCGVCTFNADGITAAEPIAVPLAHAETLVPAIQLVEASAVSSVCVTRGPPAS
jgi:hypothetical protein